jgi:hypothetical protein
VNTYADACKSLREAIEDYIDAAAWELRHKMPPLDAIDLANATAQKAVDVIAHEASQRLAGHIQIPDDLAGIFEQNGGSLVARSEARLRTDIWDDDDFLARPGREQLAYIFFISQPDISHCGVLSLRLKRWAKKLKYTTELLDGVLTGLSETRFIVVDYDEEELLVRSYLRNDNVCKNFKVLKAAESSLKHVASKPIREVIANEIERALHDGLFTPSTRPTLLEMLGSLGRPHHDLSDGSSHGSSDDPSEGHGMTHQMTLPIGDANSAGARGKGLGASSRSVVTKGRSTAVDPSTDDPDFARWYALYPRKVKKPKARTAWKAAVKKVDVETLVEAITEHSARWAKAGTDKKYIPHPPTWLNQGYWESDAMDLIPDEGRNEPTRRAPDQDAARCNKHPRELADHCTICDSEQRGAA